MSITRTAAKYHINNNCIPDKLKKNQNADVTIVSSTIKLLNFIKINGLFHL